MGVGEEVLNQVKAQAKDIAKQAIKKIGTAILTNPFTYIVLAVVLLIIIIAGTMMDVNDGVPSNSNGMSSVSESVGSLYNDDGTVNEEKMLELQVALENTYNLVAADTDLNTGYGNNIGGQYNKTNCERVTGTYLGFAAWDGTLPRSSMGGIVYQCPWWANGRASEVYGKRIVITGNAKDMYNNASSSYNRGTTPKANSLVVYDSEVSVYGHVAFVEAVDNVNQCYYISHAGSGQSWFGIQKIPFNGVPWGGYTLKGFIYVGEPINSGG